VLGAAQLQSSLAEKDLRVLVDTKMTMRKQCAFASKKVIRVLDCIRQSVATRSREAILPLDPPLMKLHLKCCVQFWDPQYKRDMDLLQGPAPGQE